MSRTVLMWRRLDLPGFERLVLEISPEQITATSTVLSTEAGGLRLDHNWLMDKEWRAQSVRVERWTPQLAWDIAARSRRLWLDCQRRAPA